MRGVSLSPSPLSTLRAQERRTRQPAIMSGGLLFFRDAGEDIADPKRDEAEIILDRK